MCNLPFGPINWHPISRCGFTGLVDLPTPANCVDKRVHDIDRVEHIERIEEQNRSGVPIGRIDWLYIYIFPRSQAARLVHPLVGKSDRLT